nr:DUF1629 domain-containing protein [Pyxidicoccus fallax]
MLGWNQSASMFRKGRPVSVETPVQLRVAEPVPPRPIMVDHHSLPAPVVSQRLMEVLAQFELPGAQLVPADVAVGDSVLRYWLVHVYNRLPCLDRRRSIFTPSPSGLLLLSLDALVLDEDVLSKVPLAQRLLFVLAESTSVYLFHRSVVDRVLALTPPPEGLRFIPVSDWNDSAGFR